MMSDQAALNTCGAAKLKLGDHAGAVGDCGLTLEERDIIANCKKIASGDGRATSVMRTIPKRSSHAIPVHGDSEQTLGIHACDQRLIVDLDELSVIAWQVRQETL